MTARPPLYPLFFPVLALISAGSVGAQEPAAEEKAAARELALAGIQLAQDGKCDEAFEPLQRAEQLYHAPTILTWIGECQIRVGRLVEGSETLRQVVREQLPEKSPTAYVDAQLQAAKLLKETEPRIARLIIQVKAEQGELKDTNSIRVEIDSVSISLAMLGVPRPTDPGSHRISVTVTGYQPRTEVVVLADGASASLNFRMQPQAMVAATDVKENEKAKTEAQSDANPPNQKPSVWGWVLVGGGTALLATGGTLGYLAIQKKNDLDCPSPSTCPPSEEQELKGARSLATWSTVAFGVGGAAAIGGLIVLLTTGGKPRGPNASMDPRSAGWNIWPEYGRLGWASVGLSGRF